MRYGVRPNCLAGFEFSLFSCAIGKSVLRLCRGKGVDDVSGVRMHWECLAGLEYNPYHPDTIIVEHHPAILRRNFDHVLSPQEWRPDKRREHTQARGNRFGFHALYSFPEMEQEYSRSADKNNPHIEPDPSQRQSLAELIDQETGVRDVL